MRQSQKEYRYQNLSLQDIQGEIWEDIPELDGYFLVSNFGRVKRQQYEMPDCRGTVRIDCEKIIAAKLGKANNKFKKDFTYYLMGKVTFTSSDQPNPSIKDTDISN